MSKLHPPTYSPLLHINALLLVNIALACFTVDGYLRGTGTGCKPLIAYRCKSCFHAPAGTTLQSRALLSALEAIPDLHIYCLTNPQRLEDRVATFLFCLKDLHPRKMAGQLAKKGIYVWDVNYYALNVIESLGMEDSGGMV